MGKDRLLNLEEFENKEVRKRCQKLWASNKYLVLSKSQNIYKEIREYLKNDNLDIEYLNVLIEKAINMDEDKGQVINAFEHIWGYFKKDAKKYELEKFRNLITMYRAGKIDKECIISYINELLYKYPKKYLLNSNFLIY